MKKIVIGAILIIVLSGLMLYAGFKEQEKLDTPGHHLKSNKGTLPM